MTCVSAAKSYSHSKNDYEKTNCIHNRKVEHQVQVVD